ncbi:MAG: hypothetical protein M1833_003465 [Piccolia ochrophora]|nr:MAG: hypothetical protein M1833_003465 [Piccolia ochrophora]
MHLHSFTNPSSLISILLTLPFSSVLSTTLPSPPFTLAASSPQPRSPNVKTPNIIIHRSCPQATISAALESVLALTSAALNAVADYPPPPSSYGPYSSANTSPNLGPLPYFFRLDADVPDVLYAMHYLENTIRGLDAPHVEETPITIRCHWPSPASPPPAASFRPGSKDVSLPLTLSNVRTRHNPTPCAPEPAPLHPADITLTLPLLLAQRLLSTAYSAGRTTSSFSSAARRGQVWRVDECHALVVGDPASDGGAGGGTWRAGGAGSVSPARNVMSHVWFAGWSWKLGYGGKEFWEGGRCVGLFGGGDES